ncbi:MAG: OmpH family outer membrane protein [Gammaproteobacteria bacterium]|nr:OmpH family outer membrane protein [Gammaproteobacteria bacterium]
MKLKLRFATILITILFVPALHAQEAKIGYVDADKILEESPQSKAAIENLEKEFRPREQELLALRDRITQAESEIDKNSLVMSDEDRDKRTRELIDMRRKLKREQQEMREDYNLQRNQALGKLQQVVSDKIIEIAKEDGFDIIFQQAVWASKRIDITDKVLKKLQSGN